MNSIWKSAGIEGLGTTFPNTEAILENLPVNNARSEEFLFILNMKRAWEFIFDNIDYQISLSFLREVNKLTMNMLLYNAGEIRKGVVTMGGTSCVSEIPNEGVIIECLGEIRKQDDQLNAALDLFCFIVRSQIFTDGNKRLAALITNKHLMLNDIGILAVPYNKIDRFKELLVLFYETNDSSKLKSFLHSECIIYNPDYECITESHIF